MKNSATAFLLPIVVTVICTSCTRSPVEQLLPPPPSIDEAYPRPTKLADRTTVPLSQLLNQYERVLLRVCPDSHAALQPGLTPQQIEALELEYDITLTDELRTLYSWRNGSDPTKRVDAFPYMRFVPLREALDARDYLRTPDESKSKIATRYAGRMASVSILMGGRSLRMERGTAISMIQTGEKKTPTSFIRPMTISGTCFTRQLAITLRNSSNLTAETNCRVTKLE